MLSRTVQGVVRAHADKGPESQEAADAWVLLWLAPTLLRRIPAGSKLVAGDGADAGPSAPSVSQVLRLRCQQAERWGWDALMHEYLEERAAGKPRADEGGLREVRGEELRRFATISRLVQGDSVERAKRVLMGE